ncbi:hypothetical protein [Cellulomonas phragmiteti]|uniref:Uncharacterized protein n=1 Tax=Cellulomonas phragmiteti TaxID=478780 RepID=A0ABQ4DHA6_9CELL|nr:hypothetical protein [Cellulomonas phragmiteti]GIG38710.1 hypothetical protein Cph01nite_04720 [Cellulomonas phragmiteti]
MSRVPRRPRRAVRPAGTVGTGEAVLETRMPAPVAPAPVASATGAGPAPRTDGTSTADPAGAPAPDLPDLWRATRSADDSDRGWGREETSSNDERLLRDKPPHW